MAILFRCCPTYTLSVHYVKDYDPRICVLVGYFITQEVIVFVKKTKGLQCEIA